MEPWAWLNGEYLPFSQARLPVTDVGLVHGASITEMTRSFAGRWFRLEQHLDRLQASLALVSWPVSITRETWTAVAAELLQRNLPLLPTGHELGLIQFVTGGQNLTYLGAAGASAASIPTVCCHTFALPCELWAEKYSTGQHLSLVPTRGLPASTIPASIKHRSRLHWNLAEQQARKQAAGSSAVVLDQQGHLAETAAGNLFLVRQGELYTPAPGEILLGISREVVLELAQQSGVTVHERDLTPEDLATAEEAFTTSTPYALLPVTRCNGQPIGTGQPGPLTKQLLHRWSEMVGLDIPDQMRRIAAERCA